MDDLILHAMGQLGALDALAVYASGLGVLLACGLGLPVPEDVTLLTMGYATYLPLGDGSPRPHAALWLAVLVGYAGVLLGDSTVFGLGSRFGLALARRRPLRWLFTAERIETARTLFGARGRSILFAARFMPGLRSVVFFVAGSLGVPLRRFLLLDGLAALLSVPLLVLAGWYGGEQIHHAIAWARHLEHGAALLVGSLAAIWLLKAWWNHRRPRAAKGRLADRVARRPPPAALVVHRR